MGKKRRTAQRPPSGYGFDYGIGITAAAVGSTGFNQKLVDANIVAVAYGLDYSEKLGMQVPAITLVGRNAEPLREAFEEFSGWAECTDADAIELTLVFQKDGGYRLCISPEVGALYKRVLHYDTVVNPLALQVTWIKVIETTSQPLIDLREHLSAGIIRPFLLRAARYAGILLERSGPIPELCEPIPHRDELLKFEIRFVDEGSPSDLFWQRIASGGKAVEQASPANGTTIPTSLVWIRRKEALKRLFPVTLWRSRSCERPSELRSEAEGRGLIDWQIDQAICNLVLSRQVADGKPYFQGCRKSDWPDQLWKALCSRFEISGVEKPEFRRFTVENVVRQAILDAGTLLRQFGIKRVSDNLESVQHLLRKHCLLGEPDE